MSPTEFRREIVQYACAALTGMLANRAVTGPISKHTEQASQVAWEYAKAMCEAAPTEREIQGLRRRLERPDS